jgi:riboflavin kinase/FMN adenylyltransferase
MIVSSGAVNPVERGAVVALGNFDGVHLGHARVIATARELADSLGRPLGVVTFEPHPRQVLHAGGQAFRLTDPDQKAEALAALGVDVLYVLPFDTGLAALTPVEFERRILDEALGIEGLVVGEDFFYGRGRTGNFATLSAFGAQRGIPVMIAPTMRDEREEPYSSTRIRQALIDGRPDQAAGLLGRAWQVSFTVVKGDQRGRTLGYPTANGCFGELMIPAHGIYAVRIRLDGHPLLLGVASIGIRPMWATPQPLIEVHIFDFDEDIYGQTLRVDLVAYLRPEAKFEGIPELVRQIETDCGNARLALANTAVNA